MNAKGAMNAKPMMNAGHVTNAKSVMNARRVWKPVDVGGLRLYRVQVRYPNHPRWNEEFVVAAKSPTNAASIVRQRYKGASLREQPEFEGFRLNVLQPAEWSER